MKIKHLNSKRENLNRLNSNKQNMKKRVNSELKGKELIRAIKEAQKDPEFIKEINKFIKVTTS